MPNIDTDVRKELRRMFNNYIRQIFGEKAVALIQTISTVKGKEAVRTGARIFSLSDTGEPAQYYTVGDKLAKKILAYARRKT